MIRHDIVTHPTALQIENLTHKKSKSAAQAVIAANQAALDTNPLETFTDKEIANAREVLANEMEFVKSKMAHGDLPIESYTKVWEECYAQVLFFYGAGSDFEFKEEIQVNTLSCIFNKSFGAVLSCDGVYYAVQVGSVDETFVCDHSSKSY